MSDSSSGSSRDNLPASDAQAGFELIQHRAAQFQDMLNQLAKIRDTGTVILEAKVEVGRVVWSGVRFAAGSAIGTHAPKKKRRNGESS